MRSITAFFQRGPDRCAAALLPVAQSCEEEEEELALPAKVEAEDAPPAIQPSPPPSDELSSLPPAVRVFSRKRRADPALLSGCACLPSFCICRCNSWA